MDPTIASQVLRVYVVEDSPLVRKRIETMLATIEGVRSVGHAGGAEEAIREILAEHPDAVVCDLRLAQGSGFDVLRALHDAAPEIDVYMLTNFATEPYRRLAARLGAREFFDKSTEFERVRALLAARVANQLH
ncbi:MAG: response regulator [Betaproteobacteria bacterium]|nr:response regulator [Betaproteobacteria bacterium]